MAKRRPPSKQATVDVAPTTSKISTPAIGVPGQLTTEIDITTGQPRTTYQGYHAQVPDTYYEDYSYVGGQPLPVNFTRNVQPRYFDGDQWNPANLGVDELLNLQSALDAAGLYSGDYILGVWGPNDANAYERLLSAANASGEDDKTTLQRAVTNAKQKKGRERAPLTIKLTNPDDIKSIANKVASDLYGGNLPTEDLDAIVAGFQGLESGAQTAAYDMAGGSGGTVTAPPDVSTFAESQIRQTRPVEVAQQGFVNALDDVLSTFTRRMPGGGVG